MSAGGEPVKMAEGPECLNFLSDAKGPAYPNPGNEITFEKKLGNLI